MEVLICDVCYERDKSLVEAVDGTPEIILSISGRRIKPRAYCTGCFDERFPETSIVVARRYKQRESSNGDQPPERERPSRAKKAGEYDSKSAFAGLSPVTVDPKRHVIGPEAQKMIGSASRFKRLRDQGAINAIGTTVSPHGRGLSLVYDLKELKEAIGQ